MSFYYKPLRPTRALQNADAIVSKLKDDKLKSLLKIDLFSRKKIMLSVTYIIMILNKVVLLFKTP
jgi:hypothetical protein